MASRSSQHEELTAVIQRYGEVADAVNRREMQRFIDEVKSKWHPESEDEAIEPRLDGYTDAGAFNLHIYQLVFEDPDPPRPTTDQPLCDAEKYNQVLFQPPLESLVDLIPKPLANPLPSDQATVKLEALEAALSRQQAEASASTQQVHLPEDFATLMASTNGVYGAGVPSETADLELVFPLERQCVEPGLFKHLAHRVRRNGEDHVPVAGWKIGGCIQHRNIYYVLCQSPDAISRSWKIFDHVDTETDVHEDLTRFLRHETERVEKKPGGAMIGEVLIYDRYPIY